MFNALGHTPVYWLTQSLPQALMSRAIYTRAAGSTTRRELSSQKLLSETN
jgi:hypothetical protein